MESNENKKIGFICVSDGTEPIENIAEEAEVGYKIVVLLFPDIDFSWVHGVKERCANLGVQHIVIPVSFAMGAMKNQIEHSGILLTRNAIASMSESIINGSIDAINKSVNNSIVLFPNKKGGFLEKG